MPELKFTPQDSIGTPCKDGLPFVFSAWLSPKREEVYFYETITLSSYPEYGETNKDFFDNFYPNNIFDLFEESEQDGLWFISGKVSSEFYRDYFGECDHDFIVDEIFCKEKCSSFKHLRFQWEQIKP